MASAYRGRRLFETRRLLQVYGICVCFLVFRSQCYFAYIFNSTAFYAFYIINFFIFFLTFHSMSHVRLSSTYLLTYFVNSIVQLILL